MLQTVNSGVKLKKMEISNPNETFSKPLVVCRFINGKPFPGTLAALRLPPSNPTFWSKFEISFAA